MSTWLQILANHYQTIRRHYPDDTLLLLMDIDGTIIDMRYMILSVLQAYDRVHGTSYFGQRQLQEINSHENQIIPLLERWEIPSSERAEIWRWYGQQCWQPENVTDAHQPFAGVMELIRWFQLQPQTEVALVTGRPNALRDNTLCCLNKLGQPYGVNFPDKFLFMNPGDWEEKVPATKLAGLRHFQAQGYRVFAFADNEPANLAALAAADPGPELLLLHATTLFESDPTHLPTGAAAGDKYLLSELISDQQALPADVDLVWHGVNDPVNLRQFINAGIRWAEVDARWEPSCGAVITRHDALAETPPAPDEQWLHLPELLEQVKQHGRAVKIDLKQGGELIDRVLAMVAAAGLRDEDLWFNTVVDYLGESGFRRLATSHPGAILQCPLGRLGQDETRLSAARARLQELADWGINRFSLNWQQPDPRAVFHRVMEWGYEVNIYNVPNLESFLQAVLMLPRSVTADFNFPEWGLYGRGSGEKGHYHTYPSDLSVEDTPDTP